MPQLSAIVPVERGDPSPVAALEGFLDQSVNSSALEVIVVGDEPLRLPRALKRLRVRTVSWPRRRLLARALTAAARATRGQVAVVIAPRWRPLPGLARYCLDFHLRHEGIADALALTAVLDPAAAGDPLLWWLEQQQMSGLAGLAAGIHGWRSLRFDAFCVKRALLVKHPVPDGEGDERLMRVRWASRAPLRVFSEPAAVLTPAGPASLPAILHAEHRAAYARLKAMRADPQEFAAESVDDRFQHPDKYILPAADQRELEAAIADLERELRGRNPRFAIGVEAEQFATLGRLYLVAVSHARASGWRAAKGR